MNCQFCEDYEWSKKHRPKTGRELYTKYYVCPECGRQLKKTKKEDET